MRIGRWATGAAAALVSTATAAAGAWTLAPGATFLSASSSWYGTDDGAYEELYGQVYAERGLREGVTLGGAVEYSRPIGPSEASSDRTTLAAFARFRLRQGPAGDPLSVQFGALWANDEGREGEPLQRAADGLDLDGRVLWGIGLGTALGAAFFDAQGGLRLRLGDAADEARLDLTAGLRPDDRWIVIAQAFGVLSLRNGADGDDGFDSLKLAPSVGYVVREGVTVGVGMEREVAGRGIDKGLRAKLFVWSAF